MINQLSRQQSAGFTLLEAMIALLVLSIGLLGLASLQARSMQYNHDALVRGQATELIMDIFEKMRSRRYAHNVSAETTINTYTSATAYAGTANGTACPTTSSNTVTTELACFQEALGKLPGGTSAQATIQCTNATASECTDGNISNNIYTVSISWVDRQTGNVISTPLSFSSQL
ncbi:MAG: type IV pilus modification protein PilV [Gammaproteobacteria bacterium]